MCRVWEWPEETSTYPWDSGVSPAISPEEGEGSWLNTGFPSAVQSRNGSVPPLMLPETDRAAARSRAEAGAPSASY